MSDGSVYANRATKYPYLKNWFLLVIFFEDKNIVAIEQDNSKPIDIEKVKASTDMTIHSDYRLDSANDFYTYNNDLNNVSFRSEIPVTISIPATHQKYLTILKKTRN
ncbi:hypothetical protein ACTFIW_001010 [Dictyostelium discoideum]